MVGGDEGAVSEAAAALEGAGYGALWIPGGAGGDVLDRCATALAATSTLSLATGILNIWRHAPGEVADTAAALERNSGGRFVLGLGVSHSMLIGDDYLSPMAKMVNYLDDLDQHGQAPSERVLAALGPRMLELSKSRASGAHPYFVPPEHTAVAREVLGEGPLLAPEQMVLLERDPSEAREIARQAMSIYLSLPNYTNNLRRLGFGDEDLTAPGSDRLVDAIVAWGPSSAIAGRVQAHFDAGADHVCMQVLGIPREASPLDTWRELASVVI
jgi:probable F420-dependent oxidoreductase